MGVVCAGRGVVEDSGGGLFGGVSVGEELPALGFDPGDSGFIAPPADRSSVEVAVDPNSDRLQLLEPFPAWDGEDFVALPVLDGAAPDAGDVDGPTATAVGTR